MDETGVPPSLIDAVDSIRDAVIAGRTDIFYKLIEACDSCDGGGIEDRKQLINAQCTKDGTFLHTATKLGHRDIVRALLDSGADPGILDGDGNSPIQVSPSESVNAVFVEELLRASSHSEVGRVCQLLASGLCVNAVDNPLSKNSPLHWAASFGDADTVSCLIARGAYVNKRNNYGATALHDAVARGNAEIVEVLVKNGAKPHIECQKGPYKGKNAFGIVKNNEDIIECLKSYSEDSLSNKNDSLCNGSPSSVLNRQSGLGSMESIRSIGTDSVITNGHVESPLLGRHGQRDKLLRAQSLSSVGEESFSGSRRPSLLNYRSPLQSSSSLEMNPLIEQVCERLSAIQLKTPPRPLVTVPALHDLWPQPKRITELASLPPWVVPSALTLSIGSCPVPLHQIVDVWNIHKPHFKEINLELKLEGVLNSNSVCQNPTIACAVDPNIHVTTSCYKININPNGVIITSGSISSLHHSIVTLLQIIRVFKDSCVDKSNEEHSESRSVEQKVAIPSLSLVDSPSLPYRGFMLDMSPTTRVPTVDQLCHIIDSLSVMKMNQLHLMFRIAYNSAETDGSRHLKHPLTFSTSDILLLERYCIDRAIDLVPGFDLERPCNAPVESVLEIIYNSLSSFTSNRYLHFGPILTSFLAEASTHSSVWKHPSLQNGRILMVCANVFHKNRNALNSLPINAIIIEYGFQADYDFSDGCKISIDTGRPLTICPGTAAWTSLAGWPEAGVSNVYSGVVSGLESGAVGVIVAHWGHFASLTPFCFSFPPLVVAAGLAWNHNTHWDFVHSSVGALIDRHLVLVADCGVGDAIIELGRCETWLTRSARNQLPTDSHNLPCTSPGSILHQLLCDPDSVIVDNLVPEAFSSVIKHVRRALKERNPLKSAMKAGGIGQVASMSNWPSTPNVLMELNLSMDMITTACRLGRALVITGTNPRSNMGIAVVNPGVANLSPTIRTDLANKILALKEVYSSVWLQSNQSQGLQTSLLVFTSILSKLLLQHNYQPF